MLSAWPAFQTLAKGFAEGEDCLRAAGLTGAARALVVAELMRAHPRAVLVVVPTLAEVRQWGQDLRSFGAPGVEFPEREPRLWRGGRQRESDAERALVCRRLLAGEPLAVVVTPAGLEVPLIAPGEFGKATLRISAGDSLERELLLEALESAGYERVETVVEVGQWSVRGGILDVFTPAHPAPARLEFFGDEVESIRLFDPTSQRSTEALDDLVLLPFAAGDGGEAPEDATTLRDYLPERAPVVLTASRLLETTPSEEAPGRLPLLGRLRDRPRLELETLAGVAGPAAIALETRSTGQYAGRFNQLADDQRRWLAEGFTIRLAATDDRHAEHLRQILADHGLEARRVTDWGDSGGLGIVVGECSAGFEIAPVGLIVLSETEIFGARRRTLKKPKYQRGSPIAAFTDLAVGDLVVHEDHGIGRYLGLSTMSVGDRDADFLLLEYAENNQLYLPVDRLELISKYLGGDRAGARLDRLGGASWQRVKESVRAALRDMAEELLKLYAQRAVAEGRAFSADAAWQREFEEAFRFEETPDQLRAIADAKRDMEAPKPMDRLVAGDVGYGKTEVALRAAFKAVADGTQVAVLVPTTVLAQQHWATFADRFAPFPVKVELLSRFRSASEQKAVVAGLGQGTVDVVIGTHRLLSKDVGFKNLGLLIVDEEHRFGVAHKERLKQFRAAVDVLSLTATPIPRTLYMSLSGVRDMSVIETPPLDRLPIDTVIRRFSRPVVKEALERELARGGQVFFVHNRVQSLPSMVRFIQELVPQARILMGHGQMKERELEATMVKFVSGEADILVSTAIIESGLDIPASNTIIVNRADRFGLAQLYQLRGRVGRERQQAYCYLLVPADGRVDERAQERLRALQEMTELGSGFKLAMRDLEIRGAGNLLGAEQHGHIAAVGFDLYGKLLAEAVRELRGDPAETEVDPVISAGVEGFLPEDYVPEVNQRLAFYKRLSGAGQPEVVEDLRTELADRFGPLPAEAEQLLDIVRIRVAARPLRVERLEAGQGRALVTFAPSTPVDSERLVRAIQRSRGRMTMKREFTVEARIPTGEWPAVRDGLLDLLGALQAP
jgi:transcription-repair coupling factor (superfamily II helicase)